MKRLPTPITITIIILGLIMTEFMQSIHINIKSIFDDAIILLIRMSPILITVGFTVIWDIIAEQKNKNKKDCKDNKMIWTLYKRACCELSDNEMGFIAISFVLIGLCAFALIVTLFFSG